MSNSRTNRAFAATSALSLLLVAFATTAQADEDVATLALGTLDTLTLPAGDGVRDSEILTIAIRYPDYSHHRSCAQRAAEPRSATLARWTSRIRPRRLT